MTKLGARVTTGMIAVLMAALPLGIAQAQSTTGEALDAIIGSQVHEQEMRAAADPQKVIAAIDRTRESTEAVRKASNLESVEIVFLFDSARTEGGPPPAIEEKIRQHSDEIDALRDEIEGNAMIYHAIDSKQVLVDDVVAVTFSAPGRIEIFAAAKPAGS